MLTFVVVAVLFGGEVGADVCCCCCFIWGRGGC